MKISSQEPDPLSSTPAAPKTAASGAQDASRDWGFSRPLFKNPWFYFALVMMGLLTVVRPFLRHVPEPPPILRDLPAFSFVSGSGEPFGSSELAGRPYVISFIFTRCTSVCPIITQKMAELHKQVQDSGLPLRLVSLTVDPAYDRPTQLREFAARFGATGESWVFLTSREGQDADEYARQVEETFGVAAEAAAPGTGTEVSAMDLAHAERLMLVDGQGRLRGLYEATTEGINEIFHRAVSLMGETKS